MHLLQQQIYRHIADRSAYIQSLFFLVCFWIFTIPKSFQAECLYINAVYILSCTILYYCSLLLSSAAVSSSSSPSPLCGVFTIIYLKQTIFVGYIVLQLFYIHSLWYIQCYFPWYFSYWHIGTFSIRPIRVVPYMAVFCYHHFCYWMNFEMSVIQNRSCIEPARPQN
jgi:hypothetical protein